MQPLTFNSYEPMPVQQQDWTCSACSLAWLNRALGIDHATDEMSAVEYIGQPEHINPTYGLMDGSGARLAACLREQGAPSACLWPSWERVLMLAEVMPLLIGGVAWCHWVGVRGVVNGELLLANSAPGWQDVYSELTADQWWALGPFAAVATPLWTYLEKSRSVD